MSKKPKNHEGSNTGGRDKGAYETASGVVFSPAYMSNGIFGTPPAPAQRGGPGNPGSESGLALGEGRTRNNGIPGKFFSKGE